MIQAMGAQNKMSQDVVSDALNQIMNTNRARKSELILNRHSKLLLSVLAIAKLKGYIKEYTVEGTKLKVKIANLNACNTIKPRFKVRTEDFDKYIKRYLPTRNIGVLIISTSQGLMTHTTAMEKNIGGSLIAYFF
jgi:small subunit ribosomal protein S8